MFSKRESHNLQRHSFESTYTRILKSPDPDVVTIQSIPITTDFIQYLYETEKGGSLTSRWQFFIAVLCFCIGGVGNFWRFSKQMLIHGQAAFLYIYIVLVLVFGTALLFLELGLGTRSNKFRFAKHYDFLPLFEGISYSMALYSLVILVFFNNINIYNFIYMVNSIDDRKHFSCDRNHTTTEVSQDLLSWYRDKTELIIKWEKVAISLFICTTMVIAYKRQWINSFKFQVGLCVFTICSLFTSTIYFAVNVDGASEGLHAIFVPSSKYFISIWTWSYAFEQCIISLGLGMGAMTRIGFLSRYLSPMGIWCLIVNLVTLIVTMACGMTAAISVGNIAKGQQIEVETYLDMFERERDFDMMSVLTHLFGKLDAGYSNFFAAIWFGSWFLTTWYCAVRFLEVTVTLLNCCMNIEKHKTIPMCIMAAISFLLSNLLIFDTSKRLSHMIDTLFLGPAVLIVIFIETLGVCYIYSVHNFCDDVEFVMGVSPNIVYQIIWLIFPVVALTFLICDVIARYEGITETLGYYFLGGTISVFIILPIVLLAIINIVKFCKDGNAKMIFGSHSRMMSRSDSLGSYSGEIRRMPSTLAGLKKDTYPNDSEFQQRIQVNQVVSQYSNFLEEILRVVQFYPRERDEDDNEGVDDEEEVSLRARR